MIVGNADFQEGVRKEIAGTLTVSKVDKDKLRFTGWDIRKYMDMIRVSLKDHAQSLEDIKELRKVHISDTLTQSEMKEYRKLTGNLSWLATRTKPDLC